MIATIIIIALVIGCIIVGILIFRSLPSTKYNKASNLVLKKEYDEALDILETIFTKFPLAPIKYAECIYLKGINLKDSSIVGASNLFYSILDLKKRLPQQCDKSKFELFESRASYEIAEYKFKNALLGKSKNISKAIEEINVNIKFIISSKKSDIETQFNNLSRLHYSELTKIFFETGVKHEKLHEFIEAIRNYDYAFKHLPSADGKIQPEQITARKEIAKLRIGELPDQSNILSIRKSDEKSRNDFFFRYALKLIKDKSFDEAERILLNDIPIKHPEIEKLKLVISNMRISNALRVVALLNEKLDFLINNNYPEEKTKELYDEIDVFEDKIGKFIPEVRVQIQDLKPSLFNRLFAVYYDQKKYTSAINLILKYPQFHENLTMLKDLGISCFKHADEGLLDEKNYKLVISGWLTAVFSDKVILDSMLATQWDDVYTFTLYNSIGSNYNFHSNLPGNVNYDEPSENNISIGEAQKELIAHFEWMLHDNIKTNELLQKAVNFYDNEKHSLERIIELITEEMLFPSPYFALYFKINNDIIDYLENEYESSEDEEYLMAGVPYVSANSSGEIKSFCEAKTISDKIIECIKKISLSELQSVNNKHKIIYDFITISNEFEDSVFHTYNQTISKSPGNENLIILMEETLKIVRNNENLKYQYANFVQEICECKIFENHSMNLYKGLELITKAYHTVPDNNKICEFLVRLISNNLYDILNEETHYENEIFRILDNIKNSKSQVYKLHSNNLKNQSRKILSQLSPEVRAAVESGYRLTPSGRTLQKVIRYFEVLS